MAKWHRNIAWIGTPRLVETEEGIGAGQSSSGLGLRNALQNPTEDFASALGVLRAPVRRMCGRAAHDHDSCPARVQVELFACTDCVAGCIK